MLPPLVMKSLQSTLSKSPTVQSVYRTGERHSRAECRWTPRDQRPLKRKPRPGWPSSRAAPARHAQGSPRAVHAPSSPRGGPSPAPCWSPSCAASRGSPSRAPPGGHPRGPPPGGHPRGLVRQRVPPRPSGHPQQQGQGQAQWSPGGGIHGKRVAPSELETGGDSRGGASAALGSGSPPKLRKLLSPSFAMGTSPLKWVLSGQVKVFP